MSRSTADASWAETRCARRSLTLPRSRSRGRRTSVPPLPQRSPPDQHPATTRLAGEGNADGGGPRAARCHCVRRAVTVCAMSPMRTPPSVLVVIPGARGASVGACIAHRSVAGRSERFREPTSHIYLGNSHGHTQRACKHGLGVVLQDWQVISLQMYATTQLP